MAARNIKPIVKELPTIQPVFNFSIKAKYLFLALTGIIFYANTLGNKYAFDDSIAIETNTYVQMGISGIPLILTNDSYASFYKGMGGDPSKQLAGGRYRPLPEIIFALERQVFGNSSLLPFVCHFVNIFAYISCVLALFYFLVNFLLKKIPGGIDIAFISCFLFTIHPIHTEVVANIKSLDEILSLLFIILTFIFSLEYLQHKKSKYLLFGTSSMLLALLSKEYSVTSIFFIPFLFYLLCNRKPVAAFLSSLPYYGALLIYLALRYNAVGFHNNAQGSAYLMNNPYLYATISQKLATEWFVLGKYLMLLFFPYPLASDYSYYQIPYQQFSDIPVLVSIAIYSLLLIWGIKLAYKKNVLAFAVFFFLLTIFIISNFVLDIGATMGERLVFHATMGFAIIVGYFLYQVIFGNNVRSSKINFELKKRILLGLLAIASLGCFGETYFRNQQWKNDSTLFMHDVNVVPNSFLVNINAAWGYMKASSENENTQASKPYLDSAHKYLLRALHFTPNHEAAYLNLGVVYMRQGMPDSAYYCFKMVEKFHPGYPGLPAYYLELSKDYFTRGLHLAMKNGKPKEGVSNMKKALLIDSANAKIWYNLGIAYYQLHEYDSSRFAFIKTLQNKPDSMDATNAQMDLRDLEEMK